MSLMTQANIGSNQHLGAQLLQAGAKETFAVHSRYSKRLFRDAFEPEVR
jgi:hypothetical protein